MATDVVKVRLNPYTSSRRACNLSEVEDVMCRDDGDFLALDVRNELFGGEGFPFCAKHLAQFIRFVGGETEESQHP